MYEAEGTITIEGTMKKCLISALSVVLVFSFIMTAGCQKASEKAVEVKEKAVEKASEVKDKVIEQAGETKKQADEKIKGAAEKAGIAPKKKAAEGC